MNDTQRALACVEALKKEYPGAVCSLESSDAFELLAATILSAQCTDARVNLVTPALFQKYPDAAAMAEAPQEDLENIIRSCGFFHTKSRNLIAMARQLTERFGGKVPGTIEELVTLPGVGRKTANLIIGDIFGKPAVVVDTHVIRITNLLGLVNTRDPVKIEHRLRELLPPEESASFCHRVVWHGRAVCVAGRPKCGDCCLSKYCSYALSGAGNKKTAKG